MSEVSTSDLSIKLNVLYCLIYLWWRMVWLIQLCAPLNHAWGLSFSPLLTTWAQKLRCRQGKGEVELGGPARGAQLGGPEQQTNHGSTDEAHDVSSSPACLFWSRTRPGVSNWVRAHRSMCVCSSWLAMRGQFQQIDHFGLQQYNLNTRLSWTNNLTHVWTQEATV